MAWIDEFRHSGYHTQGSAIIFFLFLLLSGRAILLGGTKFCFPKYKYEILHWVLYSVTILTGMELATFLAVSYVHGAILWQVYFLLLTIGIYFFTDHISINYLLQERKARHMSDQPPADIDKSKNNSDATAVENRGLE